MPSLIERVVWAFPALGDLAATLRGLQLQRQRYGAFYQRGLAEIRERDHWSAGEILAYQQAELRRLIQHASTHIPHYRELFARLRLTPDNFRTVADLAKLPVLEKSALRADPLRYLDEQLSPKRLVCNSTTGTTGVPVKVYLSPAAAQMNFAYFEARCRRVAGMRFGELPYVMFGAQTIVPTTRTKPPFWSYNHTWKQLYMSVFHLSPRYLPAYVAELRRRPYHAIMGFPNSLYVLARFMHDSGETPIRFQTAITSGELLLPEQREMIEQTFGCKLYDQYGCSENVVFAAECPEGRMHISPDFGVVEVVDDDDQPVSAGTVGHLICTSLINFGHVLLRYRVGDRGAVSPTPCPCGRPLPHLQSLDGRSGLGHVLITADGRQLSRLGSILQDVRSVIEWQLVQEDVGQLEMRVVTEPAFCSADVEQLRRNVQTDLGDVAVRVTKVERIERGRGGKVPIIVCQIRPERVAELTRTAVGGEKRADHFVGA